MNRIAILVLFAGVAFGQNEDAQPTEWYSGSTLGVDCSLQERVLASIDSAGHVTINDFQLRSVFNVGVALWDEYRAECYADSELVETHPSLMAPDGSIYAVYITDYKWIHADPTLDGFAGFIRKKVRP